METYNGHVRTPADAIILFEACRVGLLPRVQRRLSEKERQSIKSGSVFVWDEREAGMRRWTDGKSWSASRVSGSFLTYREMEGKRGGNSFDKNAQRDGSAAQQDPDSDGGGPDGYRYKPDGLIKQSFSITTNNNQHLHLISYFSRSSTATQSLLQPTTDPQLRNIRPEKGLYPESTVQEQSTIPAVTRGPMQSPEATSYNHSPSEQPTYARAPPQYQPVYGPWAPPSPMHTPPQHHQHAPYYPPQGHAPYHNQPPPPHQQMHYPQPYPPPPGPTAYDRPPPPPVSHNGVPPPPPGYYGPPPPQYHTGYPPPPPPGHAYQHHSPPASAPPYGAPQRPPYAGPPQPRPSTMEGPPGYGADDREKRHDSHYRHPEAQHAPPPPHQYSQPPPLSALQAPRHTPHHALPPPPPPPQSGAPAVQPQPHQREAPREASAPPQTSTAQTIPSISAMLNGTTSGSSNPTVPAPQHANAGYPYPQTVAAPGPYHHQQQRPHSRSPPSSASAAPRPLQDIPSHKLGFEANRDVQALRNLDKTSFKY